MNLHESFSRDSRVQGAFASAEIADAGTDTIPDIRFPFPIVILIEASLKTVMAVGLLLGMTALEVFNKVNAAERDHAMWVKPGR